MDSYTSYFKRQFLLAKETITKILENPLYQVKNFKNIASNRTIERTIARRIVQVFKAETEIEDLYKQYLQRNKKKVPKTRMGLYMQKEEEGFLTFNQFKKAIWFRRIGSILDVPDEVVKGAATGTKDEVVTQSGIDDGTYKGGLKVGDLVIQGLDYSP